MPAKVLVVEDDETIVTMLEYNLKASGFEVVTAVSAEEGELILSEQLVDLIILDWMLPDGEGIAWLNAVRADARTARLPVLMLTARAQEIDKLKGLERGADDYITKPFSPKELVARINTVLRRTAPQHVTQEIQFADCVLRDDDLSLVQGERVIQIGGTEYKLLKFFLTHSERSYTRAQLLDLVWGDHVYIEERTVDVHILRLRKILQKVGLEAHLETVRGVGYRWQNEVQK